jgi:galactokinase
MFDVCFHVLLGEHTDYNGGFVLPFALPFKTVVVGSFSKEASGQSRVVSCSMGSSPEYFTIDKDLCKGQPAWVNYVKGTIFQYLDDLPAPLAINLCIASNVPLGSGLSSSASLEVAVATFLEQLCALDTPGVTKALRCQRAEHDFADTPCGVMDQFISAMGKRGNLLLIDCRSNDYTLVPFGNNSSGHKRQPVMLITNSNVKHSLADSQYPVRVKQCQEAVRVLSQKFPHIKSLRDAT